MKVLLIAVPVMDYIENRLQPIAMDYRRGMPPYGIYLLTSVLKQAGHDVTVADLIAEGTHSIEKYRDEVQNCTLIGIGATSLSWPTARDVIKQVRALREDVPIALGGIHPTMFDRYILRTLPVQFVVRGEGEGALPALCAAMEGKRDLSAVPNLTWRSPDGQIRRNIVAPKISAQQLASFPLPDFDSIPTGVYGGLAIESSRGCAFDCAFCSTSYRRSWRGIPAEQFVDRLEQAMQYLNRTRQQAVNIVDDEFSTNPHRATEIAHIIRRRGLHPQLFFDSRATDMLHDGFVESIAEFVGQFLVGAECGYDEGLKRIGKGTTCEILESAARMLYQHGISHQVQFSFIIGLPWETRKEIDRTILFAMHLFSTYGVHILLQWYLPVPGSRLWDEARRNEVFNETMYDDFGIFRNLYLLRNGISLKPSEIWDVGQVGQQLAFLASLRYPGELMVELGFPVTIVDYFPREVLADESAGLDSLREVAHPPGEVGARIPSKGERPTISDG